LLQRRRRTSSSSRGGRHGCRSAAAPATNLLHRYMLAASLLVDLLSRVCCVSRATCSLCLLK
jgi:hypothetical protein